MAPKKYGVVYTPNRLADFVAELLFMEANRDSFHVNYILDPACGECALLEAAKKCFGEKVTYSGVDVDKDAILAMGNVFDINYNDAILPRNVKRKTADFWKSKLNPVSIIIANPPWSSEKIYDKELLNEAGFKLVTGQYDSYVLFIELAYNLLVDGGYFAFIIPDSLFESQNQNLRRFLTQKTEIKVIARLGEKIFEEVNRAATVIVCRKSLPVSETKTKCFRLSTDNRKKFLSTQSSLMDFYKKGFHEVLQSRFLENDACNFDVDTYSDEEELLAKIKSENIDWNTTFIFGRGVEISKTGSVVYCQTCGIAQGYKKSQMEKGEKICTSCGIIMPVNVEITQNVIQKIATPGSVQIYVGENVHRYGIEGECYIQLDIPGINYKNMDLYNPPKLLVRKTGLGIYGAIDYTGSMTSQTVYILKLRNQNKQIPLEYYLALLNSRVVYYYYLKVYGENEWKSHPYLTKQIIYSLPIKCYEGNQLDNDICNLARELTQHYEYEKDVMLEKLIMHKYGLTEEEIQLIVAEMNRLPNLSAINNMKIEVDIDV